MARRNRNEVDRVYWTEGEGLLEVEKWLKDGLFDKQIANNIGITCQTLIAWKKRYNLFNSVFVRARGVAVLEVVNAMFKSAKGYYVNEQVIDNQGHKRVIRKWITPSVPAQIFLAKNWAKNDYKDKWDLELKGELPVVLAGDDKIAD